MGSKKDKEKILYVSLPVKVHAKLKLRALKDDKTMSDIVRELVQEWLKK